MQGFEIREKWPRRQTRLGREYWCFLSESFRSLSVTASLWPSSRMLASALARRVDFGRARVVVELGVGTGAVTGLLLQRMRPRSLLYGIDLNPRFIAHVRKNVRDSRFVPILGRAEDLGKLLRSVGVHRVDAVVSSLGLTSMEPDQRDSILGEIQRHLATDGVMTQYQYLHPGGGPEWLSAVGVRRFAEEEFLRRYFTEVSTERVVWNLPPAKVYTCRL